MERVLLAYKAMFISIGERLQDGEVVRGQSAGHVPANSNQSTPVEVNTVLHRLAPTPHRVASVVLMQYHPSTS